MLLKINLVKRNSIVNGRVCVLKLKADSLVVCPPVSVNLEYGHVEVKCCAHLCVGRVDWFDAIPNSPLIGQSE